jgi:hypothetical protein
VKNLFVIKIIVRQGDTDRVYSMTNKGINAYMRMPGQCLLLTAEETTDFIIKRKQAPGKVVDEKEFADPLPEKPIEEAEKKEKTVKQFFEKFRPEKSSGDGNGREHKERDGSKKERKDRGERDNSKKENRGDREHKDRGERGNSKKENRGDREQKDRGEREYKHRDKGEKLSTEKSDAGAYTLNIQGIPTNVKKDTVLNLFAGTNFTSERIFVSKEGLCMGWGFVNFANMKDAESALKKVAYALIGNQPLMVKLKINK